MALFPSIRDRSFRTRILASFCFCLFGTGVSNAQTPADASPFDPVGHRRMSDDERESLYREVEEEAAAIARQGSLVRKVTRLVRPTVVHIDATKPASRPRARGREEETGSGIVTRIGGRSVVVTNRHVIHRAELADIVVRLDDGREVRPLQSWTDAGTDIGVLEIEAEGLVPARIAEHDQVEIGDTVLAFGSPFGLSHSVTLGIVSAKGRRDLELGEGDVQFQDFLQTDAAINPGNSGGPLVNLRGEVIGLNTAIASNSGGSEGIGFAIPIAMTMFVARQLVEDGSVSRGYLGVSLDRRFSQSTAERLGLARAVGARVSAVTRDSPAAAAGIAVDDVILEFDGRAVEDDDHLVSLVSVTPLDHQVHLVVFRGRQRIDLRLPLARRERFETAPEEPIERP